MVSSGQTDLVEKRAATGESAFSCVLHSEDVDAFHYTPSPNEALKKSATANIIVSFLNQTGSDPWPADAKQAVEKAANTWAAIVTSQIAIRIEASWSDLGNCDGSQFPLASAGPQFIYRNFRNAPQGNTWYPDALADALHGADLGVGQMDIIARFNRACGPSGSNKWYFGTDARPPAGRIDMVSVALHEFGHGLGLFGTAAVDDGQAPNGRECDGNDGVGCIGTGTTNEPMAYDRFTVDGNGVPLLALSNPSTVLGTALEGGRAGGIFFSGPRLDESGFDRARLYAPPQFSIGASYAHVDESTYNRTTEALMTPFLARAEAVHVPGALACGILADIGWKLTSDCTGGTTTSVGDEVPGDQISVSTPYPNPFASRTMIEVSVERADPIRIEIFDQLGRAVKTVHHGPLQSGRTHRFVLDGAWLTPGFYVVTVSGTFPTVTRPVIVVR